MTVNEDPDRLRDPAISMEPVCDDKEAASKEESLPDSAVALTKEPLWPELQDVTVGNPSSIHSASHMENSPGAKSKALIGDHNTSNETTYNLFFDRDVEGRRDGSCGEEGCSLFDITQPLERASSRLQLEDHYAYRDELDESRLVLVSCADQEIGYQAGCELIDALGFPDAHKRILNLRRQDEEIESLDVESLVKRTTKAEQRTGVLVSAFRDSTRMFLDSLFSVPDKFTIKRLLNDNEIYLVCVADPGQIHSKADFNKQDCMFSHWEIPFLRPLLLKSHIADSENLEILIRDQRERGHWSKEEDSFVLQVRRAIKDGVLENKVRSLENSSNIESTSVNELFKGDDLIHDTVVFAATFFPNLTPNNFARVVAALLGDRTISANSPTVNQSHEGGTEPAETVKEIPAVDIWRDGADKILTRCRLEIVSGPDSTKVVDFEDQKTRESVDRYLATRYSFYLEKQAERIRQCGLVFDASTAVYESASAFILGLALVSPDDFDKAWLVEIVSCLDRNISPEPAAAATHPRGGYLPSGEPLGRIKARAYTRVADLLRAMLEEPKLRNKVNEVLELLMSARLFGGVLQITKRLRFAPSFDDFHWIKQLFERGDQRCRGESFTHLLTYLKGFESDIYQKLGILRSWLPDAVPATKAGLCALNLVMKYCVDTTLKFDPEYYGSWPSRFPLFAVNDKRLFEANAKMLVELLFHPAMQKADDSGLTEPEPVPATMKENRATQSMHCVQRSALVIAVWSFILKGPPGTTAKKVTPRLTKGKARLSGQSAISDDTLLDSDAMLQALLMQIASVTTTDDRKALLAEWQRIIDFVYVWIEELQLNNPLRTELIWQLNQTRDVIRRFRQAIKTARADSKLATAGTGRQL